MKEYGETYGLEKVLEFWDVGKLTTEQAIGQILLLVRKLDRRVEKLEDARGVRPDLEGGESMNATS